MVCSNYQHDDLLNICTNRNHDTFDFVSGTSNKLKAAIVLDRCWGSSQV